MSMSKLATREDLPNIGPILEQLGALLVEDLMDVLVDRKYSLEEAAEAHHAVLEESVLGQDPRQALSTASAPGMRTQRLLTKPGRNLIDRWGRVDCRHTHTGPYSVQVESPILTSWVSQEHVPSAGSTHDEYFPSS